VEPFPQRRVPTVASGKHPGKTLMLKNISPDGEPFPRQRTG